MIEQLTSRLWSERARIGFAAALAFVAGAMLYARVHVTVLGMPAPLFTGLTYAVAYGFAAATICVCLPRLRHLVEGTAIARLGLAIIAGGFPDIGAALVGYPLLAAVLTVSAGSIIARHLHALPAIDMADGDWRLSYRGWIERPG